MYVAKDGAKKAAMSVSKTFTMALYAGAYIAFGGFLGLAVVSNCPGEHGPSSLPLSKRQCSVGELVDSRDLVVSRDMARVQELKLSLGGHRPCSEQGSCRVTANRGLWVCPAS